MRISQVVLEPVLKNWLEERAKVVRLRFGWALDRFETDDEGVTAVIRNSDDGSEETVRAAYLAGCDGAGSVTRKTLGIELDDLLPFDPRGQNGRLYLIHFRSKDLAFFERFGRAWHIQSPIGGTLISQNDVDTWTLHVGLSSDMDEASIEPREFLFESLGAEFDCEIVVANVWRPRLALAESYGRGRVWLAGDSVHQVIPTGGYGMNTGVGDAVDLGWKLAAVLEGWGGSRLLASYESERRPVGERNRAASARHSSVRGQIAQEYDPKIHEDSDEGAKVRAAYGARIDALGNLENEATGIELDYRYETSPIICQEDTKDGQEAEAPAQQDDRYMPSTWPGVRAPSLILANGKALFDLLGRGFTLIRFAEVDVSSLTKAADDVGLPLETLDLRDPVARRLYERDLVLIRPDHHVAWRGDEAPVDSRSVIDRIRGAG
jgi:2-polyprenyl-6-methoxyphenol hydroxylase-like FAD-dependent oxidoreductase